MIRVACLVMKVQIDLLSFKSLGIAIDSIVIVERVQLSQCHI